jgi:hypothetical protein
MNIIAITFLILAAGGLLALPRRWASLPLICGACYMTAGEQLLIGPFHFTVLRLLILAGVIRIISRDEKLEGGLKGLDKVAIAWGAWLLCSSFFHAPFGDALVYRLGEAYNALGFYFLIRFFCQSKEDILQVIKITAIILAPLALEMINEKLTGKDLFSIFGGVSEQVLVRNGKIRAIGPFGHSILAGTVGGVCAPLIIGIWAQRPKAAKIGLMACLCMIFACASTGPIMTLMAGLFALMIWRWRNLIRPMLISAVIGYFCLGLVMKDPPYYLMARIDLTGSSTGYHRSALIQSALSHLDEWWLAGTDQTRHWMPYGVAANESNSDITNHYLNYGVWGGLPLTILFISMLFIGFRYVHGSLLLQSEAPRAEQFMIWALGAGLFAHAVTCISVSYFDQSSLFLYLNLAALGSVYASISRSVVPDTKMAQSKFFQAAGAFSGYSKER